MTEIKKTLNQRGSKYGTFEDNARITQGLNRVIESAPNFNQLGDEHKEAFHMIFHKIARAVCGDPNYPDNPHDIAGYATLLEKFLTKDNSNPISELSRLRVKDIRNHFIDLKNENKIENNRTIEILNASFIADEETIFGEVNQEYVKLEIDWYKSQSLSINNFPGKLPQIWKNIASKDGKINSNYGWCIFSEENKLQYHNAIKTLVVNTSSRQSTMIYIRPTMHEDAFKDGMKDFMCTYAVQLIIRDNKLHYMVFMRSNDVIFGYKNDKYWHDYVHNLALSDLRNMPDFRDLEKGDMYWNAASLHVYEKHFNLIK